MGERKHSTDLFLVQRYNHLSASHKARGIETLTERFHNAVCNGPVQEMSSTLQNDG